MAVLGLASSSLTPPWPTSPLTVLDPFAGGPPPQLQRVPDLWVQNPYLGGCWQLPLFQKNTDEQDLSAASLVGPCGVSQQGRFFLVPSKDSEFSAWGARSPRVAELSGSTLISSVRVTLQPPKDRACAAHPQLPPHVPGKCFS